MLTPSTKSFGTTKSPPLRCMTVRFLRSCSFWQDPTQTFMRIALSNTSPSRTRFRLSTSTGRRPSDPDAVGIVRAKTKIGLRNLSYKSLLQQMEIHQNEFHPLQHGRIIQTATYTQAEDHKIIDSIAWAGSTPVSFVSKPWNLTVKRLWSIPRS